jgi:glycosyltransferase involved in cell wall biosynthesis
VLDGIMEIKKKGWEVIVVDDGSDDKTGEIAREKGATVITHPYAMGNGAAIKAGMRRARGETLIMMDGDGQHSPADIPRLLEGMEEYDMVVGARDWSSQSGVHRWFANKIYNALASYVAHRHIPDLTSGFRAIKREIALQYLYMLPNAFSYPTTITLSFMKSGHSVDYIPIKAGQREGKSKIRLVRDGIVFLLIISKIATIFSPFRVFLPVSVTMFLTAIGYYLYIFITEHRFTNMALLLFMLSIIVFLMGLISEQINQLRYDRTENRD